MRLLWRLWLVFRAVENPQSSRLLLRFYAPTEGEILNNGIPLEKISFRELHQRITFLEQHPRRL